MTRKCVVNVGWEGSSTKVQKLVDVDKDEAVETMRSKSGTQEYKYKVINWVKK